MSSKVSTMFDFFRRKRDVVQYKAIDHGPDQEGLPGLQDAITSNPLHMKHTMLRLSGALLALSVGLTIGVLIGRYSLTLRECGLKLSTFSPALDAVEYYETTFSGEFMAPSVYRGQPSPELDAAWHRIGNGGAGSLRISKSDLAKINKTDEADLAYGFQDGTDGFQVMLEVFHQLHCLDAIRKATWPDYYNMTGSKVERAHTDHCIEMIRINLMCTADVTPIIAVAVDWKPKGIPAPDFNTLHTCRDFEKILAFVHSNAEAWGLWA